MYPAVRTVHPGSVYKVHADEAPDLIGDGVVGEDPVIHYSEVGLLDHSALGHGDLEGDALQQV